MILYYSLLPLFTTYYITVLNTAFQSIIVSFYTKYPYPYILKLKIITKLISDDDDDDDDDDVDTYCIYTNTIVYFVKKKKSPNLIYQIFERFEPL
jgi:hypothetical protein